VDLLAAPHRCKKADLMTADGAKADRDRLQELLMMGRPIERYDSDCKQIRQKAKKVLKRKCLQFK
jgi:hypothetical protein